MAMMLPYTYTLALLLMAVAVQADPEPRPSIEAINATCATISIRFDCNKLLLDNLDVRTPQVKDVITMSVQVAAKKAAKAAAFAKAIKKPSKCITDYLQDLAVLSKLIETLPATLETAKAEDFYEKFDGKTKYEDCCSDNKSEETCEAYSKISEVEFALSVTQGLLSGRAYSRKKQQPLDNKTSSPNSN